MIKLIKGNIWFCLLALLITSCVDQDFDEPPTEGLSDLMANTTIAELKELHQSGVIREIEEDIIISGRVISDDAQGNFFKQLIIQDETGGIEMRINQNELQAVYQRNRTVFVKCQGLSIGDFNGFIQLGLGDNGGDLGRIPETLVTDYIEKGELSDMPVEPRDIIISNITDDMYGTLVRFTDVEFSRDDFGQPFGTPGGTSGTNRSVEDCLGGEITMRVSDFSDFAGDTTPFGNGTLVGVLSIFGTTNQILIRDTDDVDMPGTPCNRSGEPAAKMDINEVRALYQGTPTSAPEGKFIQGVVISDRSNENVVDQNIVVQDETGGIVVRFTSSHSVPLNEEVQVDISGLSIEPFQGWLQINNVPQSRLTRLGAGVPPTPQSLTIAEILSDFENLESTLVSVSDAEIQSGGTFSGGLDVEDGTGTITMFTRNAASFSGEFVPTGEVDIVAIVSQGGNDEVEQISIRNRNDVSGGSTGSNDPVDAISEDFESQSNNNAIGIRNWENIAVVGDRTWLGKEFSGNVYAQATSFNDNSPSMETWLITPKLNMDVITTLEFESAISFYKHDGLTVFISTDYDGSNRTSATWTELAPRIANDSDGDNTWVPSGLVDLSAYDGIGHIAWVHVGNSSVNTTSYRIDNIEIK